MRGRFLVVHITLKLNTLSASFTSKMEFGEDVQNMDKSSVIPWTFGKTLPMLLSGMHLHESDFVSYVCACVCF